MKLPYPLGPRHRYEVSSLGERVSDWLMPAVCAVVGHREQSKMYDIMCRRCGIVLRRR